MTGAWVGKSHESRDSGLPGLAESRRDPVNVLSDNANGAAPQTRPAPGSRGISS
jgi:hypothetical protein